MGRALGSSARTTESDLRPSDEGDPKLVAARQVRAAVRHVCIVFTVCAVQPVCNPV